MITATENLIQDQSSDPRGALPSGMHGAYTYQDARHVYGGDLRDAVDKGRLVGFGRGVLLDGRRAGELRTRCAGALLLAGPDGVVVGPTAAALFGCTAVGGFPIHLKVPYLRRVRSRQGLVVHQGHLQEDDIVLLDGLRVASLESAITDILCTSPRRNALACLDEVLSPLSTAVRAAFRTEMVRRLAARPDRRGTRQAADVVALATGKPECPGQSGLLMTIVDGGFPIPICQYEVDGLAGRPPHRLDFAWPTAKVAVEYDSNGAAGVRQLGWRVVRASRDDLRDPTALFIRLRAAFTAIPAAASEPVTADERGWRR
jgi:hypothetical protein